jgi:hypothetical protein
VRITVVAAVVVACTLTGLARADGDPASDFLVVQHVFLPYRTPSRAASANLARQVASVFASGDRIKVAVIASKNDLGAIPSLFGKPSEYAAFLGQELEGVYAGPLLIVMPSGYGIYDAGRSVAPEQSVLDRLDTPGSSRPDDLVASAAAAVTGLLKADALESTDILKPYVGALSSKYTTGRLTIRFYLYDDSSRAAVTATVTRGARLLIQHSLQSAASSYTKTQTRTLKVRRGLVLTGARLCLAAVDPTGNRSSASCRKIRG